MAITRSRALAAGGATVDVSEREGGLVLCMRVIRKFDRSNISKTSKQQKVGIVGKLEVTETFPVAADAWAARW